MGILFLLLFLAGMLIWGWSITSAPKLPLNSRIRREESIAAFCGGAYFGLNIFFTIFFPDVSFIYLASLPFLFAFLLIFFWADLTALWLKYKKKKKDA